MKKTCCFLSWAGANILRLLKFSSPFLAKNGLLIICLIALTPQCRSQDLLTMIGNKLINFSDPNNVVLQSLPLPSVSPALQSRVYTGAVPVLSEFAEFDQNGNLLFFAVDGAIYDSQGYLMVKKGITGFSPYPNYPEVSADINFIKVPGQCDKYYVILGDKLNEQDAFSCSVLDLSLENVFWPSDPQRKGGLINLSFYEDDYDAAIDLYGVDFSDFINQNVGVNDGINGEVYSVLRDLISFDITAPAGSSSFFSSDLHVVDSPLADNKKLIVSKGNRGWICDVLSNGIFVDDGNQCLGFSNDQPRLNDETTISFYDGAYYVFTPNEGDASYKLSKFNSSWQQLSCLPSGQINDPYQFLPHRTYSSEVSASGRYIYFMSVVAPYFYYWDLANVSAGYHELTTINSTPGIDQLVGCKMIANTYQGVSSIYLYTTSGIRIFKGVDNPSSITYISNPFPNLIVPTINTTLNIGGQLLSSQTTLASPVITQTRRTNSQQAQDLQNAACCVNNHSGEAWGDRTIISSTSPSTWTYGANPFENAMTPIYIEGNLTFNGGANVTINGMEFRFGPNANVIIKTGAIVKLNSNSKWTSYECARAMWPGVDMLGQPSQTQPINNVAYSTQPILIIDNSTIENALIGVEVGTTTLNGGGVVKGYSAVIHNCQIGVRYQKYQLPQYGAWYTSRWIVDAHLNDPNLNPIAMVSLRDMAGNTYFGDCSFIHDTPLSVYPMALRGTAIKSINSRFSLSCSNSASSSYTGPTDLNHTSFYKWRHGIFATNGGTTSFGVSKMYFQECNIGITASAINTASIVENYFHIPDVANISFQKPRGVTLMGCTGYTFRENDFYATTYNASAQNVGAMIINSGELENTSYRNDFRKLWKGQEIQGDNRGEDDMVGLQLRCNTYSNTKYDQYLASNAEWRHNQGDATLIENLANNRFSYSVPNCVDGNYDMYISPIHAETYVFDYIRPNNDFYDPNSSDNNATCTSPHMVDFCPGQFYTSTNPDYTGICPVVPSVLVIGPGIIEHSNAIANLQSARTMYTTIVDANEKTNIEAEIFKAFPMESNLMRDYLLARSPLSDQIMKAAINKNGLLDPWHLTQVLLANGPLTKDVLTHLEETQELSSFFMSFLYDAYASGSPSYRKLLEYEIAARENERHSALTALTDYYNSNADHSDVGELIKPIMLADGSAEAKIWLLEYYIEHSNTTAAQDILSTMSNHASSSDFIALKTMQLNLNNDWTEATSSQISDLEYWASNPWSSAFANSLSILHSLNLTDVLPEPEVPVEERGLEVTLKKRPIFIKPRLSAYPNPAKESTYISYPEEADGIGLLEVHDGLGQVVLATKLNTTGIYELNTSNFKAGIYLLRIIVEGKSYADSKLIVVE